MDPHRSHAPRARLSRSATALFALLIAVCCAAPAAAACPFVSGAVGWTARSSDIDKVQLLAWTEPNLRWRNSTCTAQQYENFANDLVDLIENRLTARSMAYLLRIAFHACGTWSASGRNAGCAGGWLRFKEDYNHPSNAGLPEVVEAINQLLEERHLCISFSDAVTLGGAIAVERSGGPPIAWYPGRPDAEGPGPTQPAYSARLPSGAYEAAGILNYYTNLGLTMREAVVLTGGGHSIGGAERDASGWDGSFVASGDKWPTPANQYFIDLVGKGWQWKNISEDATPGKPRPPSRVQYELIYPETTEDGKPVMRLPSDIAMRNSRIFSEWSITYALDEKAFLADFQRTWQRVLHLGVGQTWYADFSYKWTGLKRNFPGYDAAMVPLLDTDEPPIPFATNTQLQQLMDAVSDAIANPSFAVNLTAMRDEVDRILNFNGGSTGTGGAGSSGGAGAPPASNAPPSYSPTPSGGQFETVRYEYPQVDPENEPGVYLDWCFGWGAEDWKPEECGDYTADRFCKSKGYSSGTTTDEPVPAPSGVTGFQQYGPDVRCKAEQGFCKTFAYIDCTR